MASTTSRAGFLEVGEEALLGQSPLLHSQADAVGQRVEEVTFDLKGERLSRSGHKETDDLPAPRDHNRLVLFEHPRGSISKVSDGGCDHVLTLVTTRVKNDMSSVKPPVIRQRSAVLVSCHEDFDYFTGAEYQRLDHGPAPRRLKPLLDRMRHEGAIAVRKRELGGYSHWR